jgi:ribosome-associated heat shock protein Hsp15
MTAMQHAQEPSTTSATPPAVRLDVWLWAARFFRTRSLAKQAVETGKVELGGQRAKPSRVVRAGDALRVVRGDEVFEIAVCGVSENRAAAEVARVLYRESESSRLAREAKLAELRAARAGYRAPQGRPDKRARRLIRALGDIDAS